MPSPRPTVMTSEMRREIAGWRTIQFMIAFKASVPS
jgi:hypothetical protein